MNRKTIFIIVILLVNVVVAFGLYNWRVQKRLQADKMLRDATRYSGATGPTVSAFDERTDRLLKAMKEEPVEVTLQELTDGSKYIAGLVIGIGSSGDSGAFHTEEYRERNYYSKDIETILSNRRFRKAYEDLQKTNKKKAAELLVANIRDNLVVLRTMLQEDINKVSQGKHTGGIPAARILSVDSGDFHSPTSDPNHPPTRFGRKYAVFSYILLAALLELREVRPAVEEVVAFAKEEYNLFNGVKVSLDGPANFDLGAYSFKGNLFADSLYNPSVLITAALCDPSWKVTEKKRLPKEKLIEDKVVDYQSRAIEQDKDAREGWLPVVPYGGMLKIRYYKDITDAEFNDFFGK
ncbi:hypothetical protein FACS189443_6390 [Planctomycetales bacterium]|nr:hypothetical protein FACS189443_6390 [Planctomycetales bacterium]